MTHKTANPTPITTDRAPLRGTEVSIASREGFVLSLDRCQATDPNTGASIQKLSSRAYAYRTEAGFTGTDSSLLGALEGVRGTVIPASALNSPTLTLHRHNLGHGPRGQKASGYYVDPAKTAFLRDIRAHLDSLSIPYAYGEYYSPVGMWEKLTLADEYGLDTAWNLLLDLPEMGEAFDLERFKATYL